MAEAPPEGMPAFIPPPPRDRPLRADRGETPPPPPPPAFVPPPPLLPTAPVVEKRNLLDWVGERARRRPEPRLGIAMAAAGSAMLILGALVISTDQLAPSDESGEVGSQSPGVLITLAVIAAGVARAVRFRQGPLAAAGVVASAVALPPFLFFLTFSESSPPSFNTILLLST